MMPDKYNFKVYVKHSVVIYTHIRELIPTTTRTTSSVNMNVIVYS